ncbi:MAG TPA: four helix bundle protein, partial [Anaerolineaceae bacterium]|nr:four helix bundle protein [Anaerolineaceae bacterium]
MDAKEFKERTKRFALAVIELIHGLPKNPAGDVLGQQLLRSSCSVGANYRAACRAKSTADMVAKLKIVEEEADESAYWLELIVQSNLISPERIAPLLNEADELVAMT